MRKNLIYAGMLLLGLTVATSCSNEESLEQVLSNGTTIEAVIENAAEARTSVNDNYEVLWTTGDAFNVFKDGEKKATLRLSEGNGTTSGKFTIDNSDVTITEDMVALFPASETLSYEFKTTYNSQETDAPMSATFADGKFTFSLLTAMVRVVITDVPQGTAVLTISSNDMNLTGEAALNNNALSVDANGGKEVTVTITDNTASTLTFDVPVPVQNYENGLNVKLTVGNDEVFNKTTNGFDAQMGKIYVFGATYVSVDDANIETTLQEALTNGEAIVLVGENETVNVSSLSVPAETAASIDLGGNTLVLGEASARAASDYGIINNGTLVLSNGSISFEGTAYNSVAIGNKGNLTLDNINVTSTAFCVTNTGDWTDGQTLENQGDPTVILNIIGGEFTSSYTHNGNDTHTYAIRCADNAKMTITGATVTGDAGIEVNCAYADLTNVKTTANCTATGHGLYISCAVVNYDSACQFSDVCVDTNEEWATAYGATVVNSTTYSSTQTIQ